MQVADLDEVQYELEVDGELVRRQLGRKVWEARGWATVAIAFQERGDGPREAKPANAGEGGEWKPAKLVLIRFRYQHEAWHKQAIITLAGTDALELADAIASWRELL